MTPLVEPQPLAALTGRSVWLKLGARRFVSSSGGYAGQRTPRRAGKACA